MTSRAAATLSVNLPTFGSIPGGDWRRIVTLAQEAEAAGVDRVIVTDHVVMGRNTDAYAWGRFPMPPDAPWLEPLTLITAMATATTTLRFATGILVAPLRPAALLAKTVATVDVLSGGRLDLGVGTGWQREEYEAEGLDFDRRGPLLTDTVAACRALWEQTPATFESASIAFADVFCEPKPLQSRLPVWFGGTLNARNLRRIVELGDGWIPIMGSTADDVRAGAEQLGSAFGIQGSPPVVRDDEKRPDLAATIAGVGPLVAAGATDIHLNLRAFDPALNDPAAMFTAMVARFRAELA
ncbi:MAG TPA: TIGR03619 family F420-dependent LLM class oxidoreductase [Acidimicrobiales bacterium]|jgi:probable F420-dependent oxidoreductase